MRAARERRTYPLVTAANHQVDGIVDVRVLDMRAGGRGLLLERHTPLAVVLRRHGREERVTMENEGAGRILAMAVPVIGWIAVKAFVTRNRRQPRSRR